MVASQLCASHRGSPGTCVLSLTRQVDNDDAVVGEGSAKALGANTGKKPGAGAKSAAVRGSGAGRKLSASGGVKKTLAKRAGSSAVKKKKPVSACLLVGANHGGSLLTGWGF